jgi:formylglycine-generating enzyme required for sulfatase activity
MYVEWLSKKTGRRYRLPSEAEWEYAARAGTSTPFWWGALFDSGKAGAGPAPQTVDQLQANALGLRGVTGNVREWVQDCYVNTFADAPLDGRSIELPRCAARVIRGGAYTGTPEALRIAGREKNDPASRDKLTGFRVAAAP